MPRTRLILAALMALLLIPTATGAAPEGSRGDRTTEQETTTTCDGGTVTFAGPDEIWPPNHKLLPASLTFTPDDMAMMYQYTAMAGHDQVIDGEEMNGSGNTPFETDFAFVGEDGTTTQVIAGMGTEELTFPMQVRAERSGRDLTGRTYTVMGEVTYGMNMPCMFAFTILVPHDQGNRPAMGLIAL